MLTTDAAVTDAAVRGAAVMQSETMQSAGSWSDNHHFNTPVKQMEGGKQLLRTQNLKAIIYSFCYKS